jgi:hypothetical protein
MPPNYDEHIIQWFKAYDLHVEVTNTGANGICTFHVSCKLDTLHGNNQDTQNITLQKNEKGTLKFHFWVVQQNLDYYSYDQSVLESKFQVQAVNLHGLAEVE